MRTAETILNIIQDRGKRGLHLEDVYRQLFNPDLYLRAYGRIYSNDGAMTKGMTEETVDGMSIQKIQRIIEALRFERYQWTPVRRVNIPKKNGKTRPLGIPTWSDKLLQEVMRSILEAYYEPQFSDSSHGFRPNRGCHTALITVRRLWSGTKWFIEGDIKGCFDNIDHEILLSIIRERIHDNRFLKLLEGLLKAGYCEQWNFNPTFTGHRRVESSLRYSPISTWTDWTIHCRKTDSRLYPRGSSTFQSRVQPTQRQVPREATSQGLEGNEGNA